MMRCALFVSDREDQLSMQLVDCFARKFRIYVGRMLPLIFTVVCPHRIPHHGFQSIVPIER